MNQIDQIKEILFSNEKRALEALTRRIEGRESRVADTADVIADAIGRSHANGDKINKALKQPVQEIVKDTIQKDPQGFADLLFPVMGPAIRKYITESLRQFTESINRAVEEQFSIESIKWRGAARRAGIPYAQYLMQRNLEYRVDHAYLIQPETGLLMADVHRTEAIRRDDEAVSAMLSAIQDFVRETFTTQDKSSLETADIGEYSLWVMQGPEAMLACVIFGMPPRSLRERFNEVLESIHLQYAQQLEGFEGKQLSIIEPALEESLLSQARDKETATPKKSIGFMSVLSVLLLGLLLWFSWQRIQFNQKAKAFIHAVESEPGIVLTQENISGGRLELNGLLDQSARDPNDFIHEHQIDADKVTLNFTPFHSLEPEIIQQRIAEKIAIPDEVELLVTNQGKAVFSGKVTSVFKRDSTLALDNMLGVNKLEYGELYYSDEVLLAEAIRQLEPMDTVSMKVVDKVLFIKGQANQLFHNKIETVFPLIDGLKAVDASDLQVSELTNIQSYNEKLDGFSFYFSSRTKLTRQTENQIPVLATELTALARIYTSLGIKPEFVLTGYSDSTGSPAANDEIRLARARVIKGELVGYGLNPSWLVAKKSEDDLPNLQNTDANERKVILRLSSVNN